MRWKNGDGLLLATGACAVFVVLACNSSTPPPNSAELNAASACVDAGHFCVPPDGYHSASGCSDFDTTHRCGDGVSECCQDTPVTCACDDGGAGCACPPCQEVDGDAATGCGAPGDRYFVCRPGAPIPVDAGECNCGGHDSNFRPTCCCEPILAGDP